MKEGDWSSDVCSSDLLKAGLTPIFKTTDGVKANMTSISIGADLDKIFKLSKKK